MFLPAVSPQLLAPFALKSTKNQFQPAHRLPNSLQLVLLVASLCVWLWLAVIVQKYPELKIEIVKHDIWG